MRVSDVCENTGKIVAGVNTTRDVSLDEIKKQAKKFGNDVDSGGRPPVIKSNSKTHTLYNLGMCESTAIEKHMLTESIRMSEARYTGNIGAMEVMKFFMHAKKHDIKLHDYVKRLSDSDSSDDKKLGWRIIQNYLGVNLQGKGFGNYSESATSGATSAASIASVANAQKTRKNKKRYNSDGTIKDASQIGDNIFSGRPLKRN